MMVLKGEERERGRGRRSIWWMKVKHSTTYNMVANFIVIQNYSIWNNDGLENNKSK